MIEMKQICKKILILLLIVSITITGCFPNNIKKKELSFKGLDDEKLQDYVIDAIYSGVNSTFTNDDYTVDEVVTTYISKEYIEEVNYNSKSNIYFGYTLEELINKFNGVKYVFEVGEDNKTRVTEFKDYEDTYRKMLKNVAIGSGVILVCATVSIASSGTAVSIVFAASAKLATEFAVSSAALSGIISSAIEYYKTGDIQKSLEKGGLEASESFKWGAILGSVSGGISETITQLDAAKKIKSMNVVERGARSELKAYKKYGGREQVSYLNGKEVEISTIGASRPDLVRIKNGKLEALEVKNYNLNSETSIENLYRELKRQVSSRVKNLPKGSTQRIVLDIQGRNYSKKTLKEVIKGIQNACEESYHKIPVDIMS